MIKTGIDKIALYTSHYALELATLANARGVDVNKYFTGLGQLMMAVPPPGEDIVTMAACAAQRVLADIDVNDITMLIFATESGVDQSKSAGLFVHGLLGLPSTCRVVELKQACYSATFALQMVMPHLRENPQQKILLIASDIARYGLASTGESSQGAGAIAMLLSADPNILVIEPAYGVATENVMDFWRPNYCHEAIVDGKYSSKLYLTMLEKSFQHYYAASKHHYNDHQYFCYHTPVPRLVEKAHYHLQKINAVSSANKDDAAHAMQAALHYARLIGNTYTAALYVSIASLLDQTPVDLSGKRVGLYSYGSGCVAEFFSAVVQPNYADHLFTSYHRDLLDTREKINYQKYIELFNFKYVEDGSLQTIPSYQTGAFKLTRMENHQRVYERCLVNQKGDPVKQTEAAAIDSPAPLATTSVTTSSTSGAKTATPTTTATHAFMRRVLPQSQSESPSSAKDDEKTGAKNVRVYAPAKLILSGEHAVVHGAPALAIAVNRYAVAHVNADVHQELNVHLPNLGYQSRMSSNALRILKEKVKKNYHRFIRGDFTIREVLQKPFELAHFALSLIADSLHGTPSPGMNIKLESDIPIGCGMGSSAATILCVLRAISEHLNLSLSDEALFNLALEAENMQHGQSSGLDLRIALQGGCIYLQDKKPIARDFPNFPFYVVNTGKPLSSTGQCVEHTKPLLQSSSLLSEFTGVTNQIDQALQAQSWSTLHEAVRHNQQLLTRIGVVPNKVQRFVANIEAVDGVAKVCGAGAIAGDDAGAVLILHEEPETITTIANQFGYQVIPMQCDLRGVHAA